MVQEDAATERRRNRMQRRMLRIARRSEEAVSDARNLIKKYENKRLFFDEPAALLRSRAEAIFRELLLSRKVNLRVPDRRSLFTDEEKELYRMSKTPDSASLKDPEEDPQIALSKPVGYLDSMAATPIFSNRNQALTTEVAIEKIPMKEPKHGPVGFASPIPVLTSEGNHTFFPNYKGRWKDGMMEGPGIFYYADGSTYEGYWKDNRPHGTGKAQYPDGSQYDGEWQKGKYHGLGKLRGPDNVVYEGQFEEGKRHGSGVLLFPTGQKHAGHFLYGKLHGHACVQDSRSIYKLTGSFSSGLINGVGVLEIAPEHYFFKSSTKRLVRSWPAYRLRDLVEALKAEAKAKNEKIRQEKGVLMRGLVNLTLQENINAYRERLREEMAKRQQVAIEERAKKKAARRRQKLLAREKAYEKVNK